MYFLNPIRRDPVQSDGNRHDGKTWTWLTDELFTRFGAATKAPGLYEGFYTDPDTKERVDDKSRKYIVALRKAQVDDLRSFRSEVCEQFRQKCIYLSVAGRLELVEAQHGSK